MPRINNELFYTSAIKKHGATPLGVNWLSQINQESRFEVILSLLPQNLDDFSLGDAGCGFGDFYHFSKTKPKVYTGIDSVKEMVQIASTKIASEIIHADICKEKLPIQDYYICSGALNILTLFETHQFINNCYKSSKKAFIFNALYGNKESQTYNYLTKEQILSIAQVLNVGKIVFKENYLKNDITVGFFK